MIAYDRLSQIIPPDQALANKALTVALQQLNGVSNMTLPVLANTVSVVKTNKNLPLVQAQNQPINAATRSYLTQRLGSGTGVCGTILTVDMLGTAVGTVNNKALQNTVTQLNSINTGTLLACYNNMIGTLNGDYTVANTTVIPNTYTVEIPGGPGAGIYGPELSATLAINDAFGQGLIPAAQGEVAGIVGGNPGPVSIMNTSFNNICQQMGNEQDLQKRAGLDFANFFANLTPNVQTAIFSFDFALPSYGQDTIQGGAAQFLEGIANTQILGGQAVIAVMREGTNQTALNNAGIMTNSNVPLAYPIQPAQANLLPSN